MNTQPKTVSYNLEAGEFDWEIAHGKTIKAWAFNKLLPGNDQHASFIKPK